MEILKLVTGDPEGNGAPGDYTFETVTAEGKEALCLQEQLNEWLLLNRYEEEMLTSDGDSYGCGSSWVEKTCLAEIPEHCFVRDGVLLGYRNENMILFLNGKAVGRTTYLRYSDDGKASGAYCLKKKADL